MNWQTIEGRTKLQEAVNQTIRWWMVDRSWVTPEEKGSLQGFVDLAIRQSLKGLV